MSGPKSVSRERCSRIFAKRVIVPSPWDAVLLPVSAFPMPDNEPSAIGSFIRMLEISEAASHTLSVETFIQVEQSDGVECRRLYFEHARQWMPEVGLGVWPDREPPASHSRQEIMSLAAGKKLRKLMYQVLRITNPSQKTKGQALDTMLRLGPMLHIITPASGEAFLNTASAVLLPPIKDPSFTCYPFYVPLFEVKSLASATPEQLDSWFCGASTYIRESFEDRGVLVVSRRPLSPVFEGLGSQFEQDPEPVWRVPA
jgi:hypothetical protein